LPQAGSGKHTALNNGQGVANSGPGGGYEPGWVVSDDSNIAPTDTHLGSCVPDSTWTSAAARNENLPITCVNWWESYAFCIWDGGFLPSNAEWEYAAAGGSEQREYPWGSMAPGSANQYAVYGDDQGNCYYPSGTLAPCTGVSNIAPVGTANLGAGRWGQLDLAGDVFEWNMDWFAPNVDPCTDCAYLTATFGRDFQGGSFHFDASGLLPSNGGEDAPSTRGADIGFRCARSAP
jgi:formylglycine-generating enzyme required for sulfatase activity